MTRKSRLAPFAALSLVALALSTTACNQSTPDDAASGSASATANLPGADSMASQDAGPGEPAAHPDDVARPEMQMQVLLDRAGFSPGVVDGTLNAATRNALRAYQQANQLNATGTLDDATRAYFSRQSNIPATRVVTIPASFAAGPFAPLPKDPSAQAKLPALGYASLDEKLGERFHTTPEVLHALNPGAPPFAAGSKLRVPNVGADAIDPAQVSNAAWRQTLADLGVGTQQPHATRIVVSRKAGTLSVYDSQDELVALFTVTTGSQHDPLPLGKWKINGIDRNPKYHYNPALFWDVSDAKPEAMLPPGPNSPVGVVWIDLSKPHYGIHGTPEPAAIGKSESHGCVRLTNWDAARLSEMVDQQTQVEFVA
ncbi:MULTISPECIES: L,D-transpeptidase [unclassified Novosphingobium]|uniref:L,D-transpeptidase family protein n=1 Tax=unclassified Novosphingobium TaxID=2644732 RepID=UPI000D318552|nr:MULTISPECIES: L,D-transpeptidase [unclassified Novosphingobium]PTR08638.1 lipoprotein-anchoring transpeptidase ErfK/SrfK [Novosphingobium sp. GV055]PUB01361.1 lipoprotein-anchoring transpeptidase ErfK/SrfK [Novosphingobium sp. GV061]PUB16935.1 lipoprotein-anchoring transpeptidase ErfK/SrfK [Novosphingobium sp. GV079]PUB39958.1 lipoprotein-anchoring transpeptidase ErfK/SrfK [Novosphingobium sp. GV027]